MSNIKTDNTMALYHALNRIDELEALNEKLGEALKEKMICGEGAYVLRKQAEAVERLASHYSIKSMSGTYIYKDAAIGEAERLRAKAEELETGGE